MEMSDGPPSSPSKEEGNVPSLVPGTEIEEDDVEPPLSPIVGYQINSDDENYISESSSETDSETEQNLAKANAQLAKIVGASKLSPEPDTPRSKLRKRLRRRQCRKMNKEFEESSSKRQKVENVEMDESVQISKNEKTPDKPSPEVPEEAQDSIPPGFFDESSFRENEALEKEPSPEPPPIFTFTTAGGKEVKISENEKTPDKPSPEEAQNSIPPEFFDEGSFKENEALENEASPRPPPFFGFRTAGGKEVKISEHAILQAKALFSDIDPSKVTTPAKLPPKNPISAKLPLAKPAPKIPTPLKRSKKFKVPMKLKETVPEREEIRKSLNSSCATDTGMTQEVMECIEALFADEEEFS